MYLPRAYALDVYGILRYMLCLIIIVVGLLLRFYIATNASADEDKNLQENLHDVMGLELKHYAAIWIYFLP